MNENQKALQKKFVAHSMKLKERLNRMKDYGSDEDKLTVEFKEAGEEYTIILGLKGSIYNACLWHDSKCLINLENEEEKLFIGMDDQFRDVPI